MSTKELRAKLIEGSRLAMQELVKRKQKENGFLIVSENGKVVKKTCQRYQVG
jgi:hypothetical protein